MTKPGYVYVLKNPSFQGLVKIGMTTQKNVERRVAQMSTGVPTPFQIAYTAQVDNPADVEKALHKYFDYHRYSKDREWFEVEVEEIQKVIWQIDSGVKYRDCLFEAIGKFMEYESDVESRNSKYIFPITLMMAATLFIAMVISGDIFGAVISTLSMSLFVAMIIGGVILPAINRYRFKSELVAYKQKLSTEYAVEFKHIGEYRDHYNQHKHFEARKEYLKMKRRSRARNKAQE